MERLTIEKAKQSTLHLWMIDGKISGNSYGESDGLAILICRAAYDLLDSDPEMYKPLWKGLRKVKRMKRIDRIAKWFYNNAYWAFAAAFACALTCLCFTV